MAMGALLLLGVVVWAVEKKKEAGSRRTGIISCGGARSINGHGSWPTDDNSGSGCMHQTVNAALPGRVKRVKMHAC
ncbi:hypothetical protein A4H97_18075 [Niastella yeongjuensis]|uniref:Uncharacterized protein n=2 Tax=Niastella yeongjuensis TaxID=354355 RepID=A0A1V9DXQ0_9BACT|nr:hypothetical protein A4H97_18075 [Niastella yeongjuensis]